MLVRTTILDYEKGVVALNGGVNVKLVVNKCYLGLLNVRQDIWISAKRNQHWDFDMLDICVKNGCHVNISKQGISVGYIED